MKLDIKRRFHIIIIVLHQISFLNRLKNLSESDINNRQVFKCGAKTDFLLQISLHFPNSSATFPHNPIQISQSEGDIINGQIDLKNSQSYLSLLVLPILRQLSSHFQIIDLRQKIAHFPSMKEKCVKNHSVAKRQAAICRLTIASGA